MGSSDATFRRMHMLLTRLGVDEDMRHDLVRQVTGGRTQSSKDLSEKEMEAVIQHLERIHGSEATVGTLSEAAQRMRRKVFSLAHDLGWENDKGQVDKEHLSGWLLKYGYLHKPLMDYNYKELPALVTQLENMLIKDYGKER